MSNGSENKKDLSGEVSDASVDKIEDEVDTSEDSQDNVNTNKPKEEDQDSTNEDGKETEDTETSRDKMSDIDETKDKKEIDFKKDDDKNNIDEKESKKESKNKKIVDTENGEEEDGDEIPKVKADEIPKKGGKKGISSSNKVLEQSETKKANKNKVIEHVESKEEKMDASDGKGMQLGEIPRVDASISRFKNDDLKLLYRLLFKTPGKTALIAKSIKKFNGFGFKKDTEDYTKKIESAKKFELKQLKSICEMLDLEKKGTKDEIAERIIDFLIEPKDSGKQAGGGRPKRTAAVRANNRGYSSHDDSYSSDERRAARASGRGKGKRTNLKDDTTSESDQEFHLSDTSETQSRSKKRKRPAAKVTALSDEDEVSEAGGGLSSDESDGDQKKRKMKKVVNSKPKPKVAPGRRGRKPAAETEKKASTPKKPAGRKRAVSEESNAAQDENASSSEDEPLIKKAKSPQPPTDEEIKKYVKEILDGANLEEITMKTVCKQVYAHYPDFDLAHKKDFIKITVKSLIST